MTGDYPKMIVPVDHTEPVPRRVRAVLNGRTILDTTRAVYLWEVPYYPQYYIPAEDLDPAAVVDEDHVQRLKRGSARRIGLRAGDQHRPAAGRIYEDGLARLDWDALDAWFEEDEQVFVHPRNPYTRVDALRSTRTVQISLDGVVLAESSSPVMVFETGLPTRYYLNRTDVDFSRLVASPTRTACPYKGRTSDYWSVGTDHPDLAWAYDFPTAALLPIAGLVCFYNEKVDVHLDGRPVDRPATHFS